MNGKSIGLPTLVLVVVVASMLAQPAFSSLQVTPRSMVYVREANSNTVIPGASVFLDGALVGQTDSQGSSFIQGRLRSPQRVTVTKNGYDPYETTINVERANTLTAYLTPAGGRLHTEGRWIKDVDGNVVRLVGAARHWSTLWYEDPLKADYQGFSIENPALYDLFASTDANTVRLCLNYFAWENSSEAPIYRPAVDTIIQEWAQRHAYVVLGFHANYDMISHVNHWSDDDKINFIVELNRWKDFMVDLARRYATYPNVIGFDLLNEPPRQDRSAWQTRGYNEAQAELIWRSNVSKVIEAIRGIDPSYLVFVEPLGAEDLSRFFGNPLPFPNNVVYVFHRYYGWDYPWFEYAKSYGKGDFDGGFQQMQTLYQQVAFELLDMNYPVVLMETGTQKEEITPNHLKQMDDQYRLLEQYQVGVLVWSYDNGYPNDPYGYLFLLKDDLSGLTDLGELWAKHMHPTTSTGSTTTTTTTSTAPTNYPTANVITSNGGASIDTSQSVFGGACGKFVGASSQYLSTPDSDDWYFSTGDFTIDFRVRFNSLPSSGIGYTIYSQYVGSDGNNRIQFGLKNVGGSYHWFFRVLSGGVGITKDVGPTTISTNTWYHVAYVRSWYNWYVFQDGRQVGSFKDSTPVPNLAASLYIGRNLNAYFDGWLDEFRVSKGIARWTNTFTPPTVRYDRDSYTVLLLHMDGANGTTEFLNDAGTG